MGGYAFERKRMGADRVCGKHACIVFRVVASCCTTFQHVELRCIAVDRVRSMLQWYMMQIESLEQKVHSSPLYGKEEQSADLGLYRRSLSVPRTVQRCHTPHSTAGIGGLSADRRRRSLPPANAVCTGGTIRRTHRCLSGCAGRAHRLPPHRGGLAQPHTPAVAGPSILETSARAEVSGMRTLVSG